MKTASSQAFTRAATHLGDAFGLSLYNDGSPAPVVNFSAAHPPEQWEKVAAPLPEPNDAPVRPEPGSQPAEDATPVEQEQSGPAAREADLDGFVRRMRNGWNELGPSRKALAEAKQKDLLTTVIPFGNDHLMIKDILEVRIKQLQEQAAQGGATEGQAA
jgi:hypothetical protein